MVTGVAIGGTTVTATSGAITSPPAAITVTNSVPAIISFGRDTLAIGRSAVNAVIPVYLSRPNGTAVTVNLAVADTFDAMIIDRPYQKGFSMEDTLNRILWRAMKGSAVPYPEWAITNVEDVD